MSAVGQRIWLTAFSRLANKCSTQGGDMAGFREASKRGGKRPGAGRKPLMATVARRRALAEANGSAEFSLGLLIAVLEDEEQPIELRLECAVAVMDRVWGKPKVFQEHSGPGGAPLLIREVVVELPEAAEEPAVLTDGDEGL